MHLLSWKLQFDIKKLTRYVSYINDSIDGVTNRSVAENFDSDNG